MKTSVAKVAVLLLLLAAVSCREKKTSGTPVTPETMIGSESGVAHVDEYYRFAIRLGPRWRLLDEEERANILPDAPAVVSMVGGAYGAVIVEPYPSGSLEDFSGLIETNMGGVAPDAVVGERREVDFAGVKAHQRQVTATLQGIRFDYEVMTHIHQGMGYQFIVWKPEAKGDRKSLDEFLASVSIEEGIVRVPPPPMTPDSIGLGNRISSGRFESAVSRLTVAGFGPWGLMWGQSLAATGDDAEIGLQRADLGIFVVANSQRVSDETAARFVSSLDAFELEGEEAAEKRRFKIAGRDVDFREILVPGQPAVRIYFGHFVSGDRGYRIKAWHLDQQEVDPTAAVAEGLAAFDLLSDEAASKLRAELDALPDASGSAGEDFSIRGGVYRDFARGVVWQSPAGFWQIESGDAAAARNADSSLHAIHVDSGLTVQVVAEEVEGVDPDGFHEYSLQMLEEGGFQAADVKLSSLEIDGHEIRRTAMTFDAEDATLEYHVATAVIAGTAYQLNCFATAEIMAADRSAADRALAGFSFPGKKLRKVDTRGGKHRDLRMGYEWTPQAGALIAPEKGEPVISKLGSSASCRSKHGTITHIAVQAGGAGNDATIAGNMVKELFKLNFDSSRGSATADRIETIGGVPANVRSGRSGTAHVMSTVFRSGGVLHVSVLVAKSEKAVESLFREYQSGFSLIP